MKLRLNVIIFTSLFLTGLLTVIYAKIKINHDKKLLAEQLNTLELSIENEYKKRLKESVEDTINYIDSLYLALSENENIKEDNPLFLMSIRQYLYSNIIDKNRYSWINKVVDFNGGKNYAIRLIHPNLKNTEGVYLDTSVKDIKGNSPYLEELEGIKKYSEIYFTYFFKQLNSDKITKKLTYAKLYKRFNWIVATGIPLNDLSNLINKEQNRLKKVYKRNTDELLVFSVTLIFVFILLSLFFRKMIIDLVSKNIQSKERYKEAIDIAEDGIWEYYPQTKKVNFNKKWKSILGYKENEIKNSFESWENLVHPKDISYAKEKLSNFLKGKENEYNIECRMLCKDLKYKWILSRAKVVKRDIEGKISKITGIHSDIDSEKRMDLELKEYQNKLEEKIKKEVQNSKKKDIFLMEQSKMASLGEMLGNIAHQWRQPLSVISTAASTLDLESNEKLLTEEKINYYTTNILHNTEYLSETIDTFRNFIKEKKEKTNILLQERIDISLKILNLILKNNNIEIINKIDYSNPIYINMVKGEFSQVIVNIISNAKDMLIQKKIKNPWICLELEKKNKKVVLSIEDNAGGVPEDIINNIFEPYFTTKHEYLGTGLGLYMSYKIINESLKGSIYVKNTKNGAKFFIELPLENYSL